MKKLVTLALVFLLAACGQADAVRQQMDQVNFVPIYEEEEVVGIDFTFEDQAGNIITQRLDRQE